MDKFENFIPGNNGHELPRHSLNTRESKKRNFLAKFEKIFLNLDQNQKRQNINNEQINLIKQRLSLYEKKQSVIKAVLQLKRTNEWNEFKKTFKKRVDEEASIKETFKSVFNINSYFVVIWKTIFALFNVMIVFLYFFKVVFLEIALIDEEKPTYPSKNNKICYQLINLMFGFEFAISLTIIIFNRGSLLSYIKLPLKCYMAFPFPLEKKYFYFLLPKFARIDLVERLFTFVENFCNSIINNFIHNYYLKISMTYLNQLFKYLLIFGLYAHFIGCLFSYSSKAFKTEGSYEVSYLTSLYFTLETFTTIGFGDVQPKGNKALFILIIINMFIGVNLFYLITTNIKILYLKIYGFNRDTSFRKQFESLVFSIQKSTGRILPKKLKAAISSYLNFRRGLCFKDLEEKYEDVFKMCRYDVKNQIRKRLFDYLIDEYKIFFTNCSEDFTYRFFENFEPKIFKAGKIIIEYGKHVKKLYFLLSGELFAYDKNEEVIFGMNESTIFGDWEFLNNLISDVTIKVNPKKSAYGFTIDKETFDKIAKEDIVSAKQFILKSFYKKQKHLQWLNEASSNSFENILPDGDMDLSEKIDALKKNVSNLEFQLINLKNILLEKI